MSRHLTATELRKRIRTAIVDGTTGQTLPKLCSSVGLGDPEPLGGDSKGSYVQARLDALPDDEAARVAVLVGMELRDFDLEEAGRCLDPGDRPLVSEATRRTIVDDVCVRGDPSGRLDLDDFLEPIWPIDDMPSTDPRYTTFREDLRKHVVLNDDWTLQDLFTARLELPRCSNCGFRPNVNTSIARR